MTAVGIPEADQEAVFRVVAAILSLGNVQFVTGADGESSDVAPGQGRQFLDVTGVCLLGATPHACMAGWCEYLCGEKCWVWDVEELRMHSNRVEGAGRVGLWQA